MIYEPARGAEELRWRVTAAAPLERDTPQYYRALDGLRGLAILIVIAEHWWAYKAVLPFGGAVGVNIFFVLSGFLITEILLRQRGTPVGAALRKFWWRRSLRIFPVYYLYVAILMAAGVPFAASLLPWALSYTINIYTATTGDIGSLLFSHLWSLSIEEQFYLAWPVVVLLTSDRWLRRLLIAIPLAAIAFRYYALTRLEFGNEIAYRMTPAALDALGLGAILAYLKSNSRSLWARLMKRGNLLTVAILVTGSVAVVLAHTGPSWYPLVERTSSALLGAALVCGLLSEKTPGILRRAFTNKLMVSLGKISYGLYVYHLLSQYLLEPTLRNWIQQTPALTSGFVGYNQYIVSMPIYFAGALLLAGVSFVVMERPLLRFKSAAARQPIGPTS